ncbi:electrogenic sodium bicarbonate cotransporter 1-like isoform X1 [Carassius gibelio]|uniref:electrogenic sodium bicarbonate cotransporter 1-like isoform X1 n=1 Tax=Carassius gibelio TaxID=101364 RepID=UPI0022784D6F|nr:electrogenic sodium bicarbonate cotransporter 1-like isoform X1 [Carassius gibelio]
MFLKKFKMSPFFPTIPTSPNRGWFVPPFGGIPWWVYLAAALPVLLVTILLFMDQQITAVIVNRKEHKLKILALVAVRKALDLIFFQHDLSFLDDVIPEKDKKKKGR